MPISNGWNLQPSGMITIIALIFAVGGYSYQTVWRVEAMEVKQKEQEKHQAISRERLGKIETHMDYAREDLREIKELVKTLEKRTRIGSSNESQ